MIGICGIGYGHINRQLPLIDYLLSKNHEVVIFGYGTSLSYFTSSDKYKETIATIEISNPYYVGNIKGLDFETTLAYPKNKVDHFYINTLAFKSASIKSYDLIISDYEEQSAKYAYAMNVPLVTFDQQSKYFYIDPELILNDTSCKDEIIRLRMFFPTATKRIAVSFFSVKSNHCTISPKPIIIAPIIRKEITNLLTVDHRSKSNHILVYLTEQVGFTQNIEYICNIFSVFVTTKFHLFISSPLSIEYPTNVTTYIYPNENFTKILGDCQGVICTAGHGLLSECMYLGKPVYALPLKLFEQQMNAKIISDNNFGISCDKITVECMKTFLFNLKNYSNNIKSDPQRILMKNEDSELLSIIDDLLIN